MARIYLVRHGRAAASFDEDHDPGLDDFGQSQAVSVGKALATLGPMAVVSSPLRRCRETSLPLSQSWGVEPTVVPEVAEVPSPTEDLKKRTEWLRSIMAGSWRDIDDQVLMAWRQGVIDAVAALTEDTVVFSHFVAINVIAGHLLDDDRLVVFRPDNCSVTSVDVANGILSLVKLGDEAATQVG